MRLVGDWNAVTRSAHLVKLPRYPNIASILDDYVDYIGSKQTPRGRPMAKEVAAGLRVYFNQTCTALLLYKEERKQFAELRAEHVNTDLSELCGAEHFLRLFGISFYRQVCYLLFGLL